MTTSMTGFIRQEQQFGWAKIVIELRCVNGRYLDVSMRLPDELRSLEFELKKICSKKIHRGKLGVNIQMFPSKEGAINLSYNADYAKKIATVLHEIDRFIYNASPVNAIDILTWPGVMDSKINMSDEQNSDICKLVSDAIDGLQEIRQREGDTLGDLLLQRCDSIMLIVDEISASLGSIIKTHKEKLEVKLSESILHEKLQMDDSALNNGRIEQEIILFIQKMDISEEIDRLITHINEVRRTLNSHELVAQGRRLDFLMQELNREANTIGSKSASAKTSNASVDLKVQIEQMREQIQNIE